LIAIYSPLKLKDPRPGQPFPLLAVEKVEQQIPEERLLAEVNALGEVLLSGPC